MKLVAYEYEDHAGLGVWQGDHVIDLASLTLLADARSFIYGGPESWQEARRMVEDGQGRSVPIEAVRLRAPITNPQKIIAIGLNYMDHIREQKGVVPERPLVFAKFPSAIIGPGDAICWDPQVTAQVDLEVELGVVIGRQAKNVPLAEALDYVFGYTVLNDVSARDLQYSDKQWVRAKSLNTFCPIGPVIVTADEIPDPQNLKIKSSINGFVMQDSTTHEMIFGVRELIADLSRFFVLEPGDIIATGTPDGVGVFRKPQIFLKDGDHVVVEIEGIGRLENVARFIS